MDIISKQKRSEIMSKVKCKNTKPEILIRKALFAKGFRYRINVKALPGTPDIVLKKNRTIIFVHGCFWHGHDCKYGKYPSSNAEFWKEKQERNKERDQKKIKELQELGWNVIVIWECEIKNKKMQQKTYDRVIHALKENNEY